MGILREAIGSDGSSARPPATAPATPSAAFAPPTGGPVSAGSAGATAGPPAQPQQRSELRRRRDALAEQVTELHWDLGGLAYEMAIRDHFRLDVLIRRAAVLQEHDAELAEIERLLRLEDGAVAGSCWQCAAPHSRGAVFCWQCGATLMERSRSAEGTASRAAEGGQRDTTAVMDALLAPASGETAELAARAEPTELAPRAEQ
jgi:hypothetical protein